MARCYYHYCCIAQKTTQISPLHWRQTQFLIFQKATKFRKTLDFDKKSGVFM